MKLTAGDTESMLAFKFKCVFVYRVNSHYYFIVAADRAVIFEYRLFIGALTDPILVVKK